MKKKSQKFPGVDLIRSSVILLMESIPELNALKDEAWFNAEDRLVKLIEEIITENKQKSVS